MSFVSCMSSLAVIADDDVRGFAERENVCGGVGFLFKRAQGQKRGRPPPKPPGVKRLIR